MNTEELDIETNLTHEMSEFNKPLETTKEHSSTSTSCPVDLKSERDSPIKNEKKDYEENGYESDSSSSTETETVDKVPFVKVNHVRFDTENEESTENTSPGQVNATHQQDEPEKNEYQYSNIELYEDDGKFYLYDRLKRSSYRIQIDSRYVTHCNNDLWMKYLDDVYDDLRYVLQSELSNSSLENKDLLRMLPVVIQHVNDLQEEKNLGMLKKAIVIEMLYSFIDDLVKDKEFNHNLNYTLENVIPDVIDLVCKVASNKIDIGKREKEQVGLLTKIWKLFF